MKNIISSWILAIFMIGLSCSRSPELTNHSLSQVEYINTFIGVSTNKGDAWAAHGLGKTFPGAATPFGLVQVSPNTITSGDNKLKMKSSN